MAISLWADAAFEELDNLGGEDSSFFLSPCVCVCTHVYSNQEQLHLKKNMELCHSTLAQ